MTPDQLSILYTSLAVSGLLATLKDAGNYVTALPAAEHRKPHWQAAAEVLILVAERGGRPMMARIGVMRALNHGKASPAIALRRKRARVYKVVFERKDLWPLRCVIPHQTFQQKTICWWRH